MTEKPLIIDEITTLRLLHDIRAEMQKFSAAPVSSPQNRERLIEAYNALNPTQHQEAVRLIKEQIGQISFNPYSFKTTTKEEDKAQQKAVKKSAAQNKTTALLNKQIVQELEYQHSRGKMTDVPADAVFESVSVDKEFFRVRVAGREEALLFPVKSRSGKYFSALGAKAVTDPKYAKQGFDNSTFKLLSALGAEGFRLETAAKIENVGKKYSPSAYKTQLGLKSTDNLTAEQQKELDILNGLSAADQAKFIIGVKKRRIELQRHQEFMDKLGQTRDAVALLADSARLKELAATADLPDFSEKVQDAFIKNVIQTDKNGIWKHFDKQENDNSRFSYYQILQNNLISQNTEIFKETFNFDSAEEIKNKLRSGFQKIRNLATPPLPDALSAEILALGIFQNAVTAGTDTERVQKMNLLLNEFGLNVKFAELPVTKVPAAEIANGIQQIKLSREAFEQDKRTAEYKAQDAIFQNRLKAAGIEGPDAQSTHHYLALKYAPFIDTELNQSSNYVRTARKHPWNPDGHNFTHEYDTAGEFLITDKQGKLTLMDFNRLRKSFNNGSELFILAPVLQIRDPQTGKFRDLLARSETAGQPGIYISDDKTANSFANIPEYCRSGKDLTPKKTRPRSGTFLPERTVTARTFAR